MLRRTPEKGKAASQRFKALRAFKWFKAASQRVKTFKTFFAFKK